jgi:hypothetical protein
MNALISHIWALFVCGIFPATTLFPNISKKWDLVNILLRLTLTLLYLYSQILRPSLIQEEAVKSKTYEVTKVLVRVAVVAYGFVVLIFTSCYCRSFSRFCLRRRKLSTFTLALGCTYCLCCTIVFARSFNGKSGFRFTALAFYLALSGCVLVICLKIALIGHFKRQVIMIIKNYLQKIVKKKKILQS